jgi:cyclophilin family peptidyl-prolyl cis-trans isomerase
MEVYLKKNNILFFALLMILMLACSTSNPLLDPNADEIKTFAPNKFKVKFETTKGKMVIDINREYSPLAVDRFYYLVKNNYYDFNRFFRVLPNFVVQWGMRGVPEIDKIWSEMGVNDEPVKLSNLKGTISFARSGPNTRSNQLFINLGDNQRLDESDYNGVKGFPAFGKVVEGMDVVESINSEYLQEPNQDSISIQGNTYLTRNYPNLDYIISTEIIEE